MSNIEKVQRCLDFAALFALSRQSKDWLAEGREQLATLLAQYEAEKAAREMAEAECKAARDLCESWHADARAEGYGGGNTRAHLILEAMNAARGETP